MFLERRSGDWRSRSSVGRDPPLPARAAACLAEEVVPRGGFGISLSLGFGFTGS